MKYVVTIAGEEIGVSIGSNGAIAIEGEDRAITIHRINSRRASVHIGNQSITVDAFLDGHECQALLAGNQTGIRVESERDILRRKYASNTGKDSHRYEVHAPMPALVTRVEVSVGDSVSAGQGLLILEAMKMENEIKSPRDGKVKEIYVQKGKTVEKGELLILLE
jgi:biotin carboxyl carrier protein